ncbi:MAG: biopolymer transporter ExbD [Roseivirga sp.]
MKLSNQHRIDPQFSMSSMTDVVFLLLIFFLLTVASVTPQALPIDLPVSSNTDTLLPQVNVMITADLCYYVDNQPTDRAQLESVLQQKLNIDQRFVLLQVDKSVPIAQVVYVTDIAASLHAKVAVATQSE